MYKLQVNCEATQNAMSAVVNLKYLFRGGYLAKSEAGSYEFVFPTVEERAIAEANMLAAFPDAVCDTADSKPEKPAKKPSFMSRKKSE